MHTPTARSRWRAVAASVRSAPVKQALLPVRPGTKKTPRQESAAWLSTTTKSRRLVSEAGEAGKARYTTRLPQPQAQQHDGASDDQVHGNQRGSSGGILLGEEEDDEDDEDGVEHKFLEAIDLLKQRLPEGHPDVARSIAGLAKLYKSQGRHEQAENAFVEALNLMPIDHIDTAGCLLHLAESAMLTREHDKAESM